MVSIEGDMLPVLGSMPLLLVVLTGMSTTASSGAVSVMAGIELREEAM